METKLVAAVFLFAIPANADERPLERRVLFPDLVGVRVVSGSNIGAYTSVGGLVSYSSVEAFGPFHAESFGLNPAFDIRAGRLTIGGALHFSYQHLINGPEQYGLSVVPRVGALFPISKNVTLWPRIGIGFLVGSEDVRGFQAHSELLVALDIGSHLFLAAGPQLAFTHTEILVTSMNSLNAGATAALGMSF